MGKLSGKNQGICFTKLSGHPDQTKNVSKILVRVRKRSHRKLNIKKISVESLLMEQFGVVCMILISTHNNEFTTMV